MAKVHKSFRIEEAIAAAVSDLANEGETEAATYNRVLSAGVAALTASQSDNEQPQGGGVNLTPELFESMQAHIDTLKAANEKLGEQLEVKDGQIRALSVLTAQAQELHGAAVTKAIEPPQDESETGGVDADGNQGGEKRRSWWARLWS